MIDDGAAIEQHFGHHVGEVGGVGLARIMFDDRRLGARAGFDQYPRMAHHRPFVGPRQQQHVDRLVDHRTGCQTHDDALFGEGGIERRERREIDTRQTAERTAYCFVVGSHRRGQRFEGNAGRQAVEPGQLGTEHAVDQHQPIGVDIQALLVEAGSVERGVRRQSEIALGNTAHVGIFPLFVTSRGKTQGLEARRAGLAPCRDPAGVFGAACGQTLEKAFRCTHAADPSSTQS